MTRDLHPRLGGFYSLLVVRDDQGREVSTYPPPPPVTRDLHPQLGGSYSLLVVRDDQGCEVSKARVPSQSTTHCEQ